MPVPGALLLSLLRVFVALGKYGVTKLLKNRTRYAHGVPGGVSGTLRKPPPYAFVHLGRVANL